MNTITFTETEFEEFLFVIYFLITIPVLFAFLQFSGVQPLQKLKEKGCVNTSEKKVLFYTSRFIFNFIGFSQERLVNQ